MFQVRADGVIVTNAAAYGGGWKEAYAAQGLLPAPGPTGSWFRAATAAADAAKLTALGFSGNGYLDDLAVTASDPFALLTSVWLAVWRSEHGGSSLGPAAMTSIALAAGASTQIVYQADDWYRIAALTTNGINVDGAAGQKSAAIAMSNVAGDISNNVSFAYATPAQLGTPANVPTAWLASFGYGEGAPFVQNALGLAQEYLLNVDPYATNTVAFSFNAIQVSGTNALVTLQLLVNGAPHPTVNGAVKLYGWNGVSSNVWSAMEGTAINGTNAFDATTGSIQYLLPLGANGETQGFARGVIE
jgi:hypothetical protein